MKKIRPIKGSQLPLRPNDVAPECICVPKVYDWVIFPNRDRNKVPIPEPCRTQVEELIEQGIPLRIDIVEPTIPPVFPIFCGPRSPQPGASCSVLSFRRTQIPGPTGELVDVAVVRLLFSITVTVIIVREDTGVEVCRFDASIQLDDEVVLCLPEPLNETNIRCRIIEIDVVSTGIIFDGLVELDVALCKEVQVEADVKLEVLAKFCQPRGPIPVPNGFEFPCPPRVDFPPQCPTLFPLQNCDCQGAVVATNQNVIVSLGAQGTDVGTTNINADICPNCSPTGSTLFFQFVDTDPEYTVGDQSFTFQAAGEQQIEPPTCFITPADITAAINAFLADPAIAGTPLATTIAAALASVGPNSLALQTQGVGVRTFTATGTQETLNFTLFLMETDTTTTAGTDLYILTLDNGASTVFAVANLVPDAALQVRDCLRFPSPV